MPNVDTACLIGLNPSGLSNVTTVYPLKFLRVAVTIRTHEVHVRCMTIDYSNIYDVSTCLYRKKDTKRTPFCASKPHDSMKVRGAS